MSFDKEQKLLTGMSKLFTQSERVDETFILCEYFAEGHYNVYMLKHGQCVILNTIDDKLVDSIIKCQGT